MTQSSPGNVQASKRSRRSMAGRYSGDLAAITTSTAITSVVGLVRVPLAISAGGDQLYAYLASANALLLWLLIVPMSLRTLHRSVGASSGVVWGPSAVALAIVIVATGCVAFVLGTSGWAAGLSASREALVAATVAVALVCALVASFGARQLGRVDLASGTHVVHVLSGASALAGLPLYALVANLDVAVAVQVLVWLLPAALPFILAAVHLLPPRWRATRHPGKLEDRTTATPYILLTLAPTMAGGLGVFIVGYFLSSADVAAFSLATRLAAPVFLVPSLLFPFVGREVAIDAAHREERRLFRLLGLSLAISSAVGLLYWLVAPELANWLSSGSVAAPPQLYGVIALQSVSATLLTWLWGWHTAPTRVRTAARMAVGFGFATIALAIYLTPLVGVAGPRVASLTANATQSAVFAVLVLNRRTRKPGINWTGVRSSEGG